MMIGSTAVWLLSEYLVFLSAFSEVGYYVLLIYSFLLSFQEENKSKKWIYIYIFTCEIKATFIS